MSGALLSDFGAWIADAPPADDSARAEARLCFLDTAACIAVGAVEPVADRARTAAALWSGAGACHAFGAPGLAPAAAAFALGVAAHALDFDDSEVIGSAHPSAVLVPTLLALGAGRSYGALLDAYAVGVDAIACLGGAMGYAHYQVGWHATATLGPIGAAAAAARLLRFDAVRAAHALALACSRSGGLKRQFGSDAKPAHAGFAAMAGVECALLAQAGVEARPDLLEGDGGFFALYGGGSNHAAERPTGPPRLPVAWIAREAYPSCHYTHRLIAAALSQTLAADEIQNGEIEMPESYAEIVSNPAPRTPSEARFSVRYCVAAALIDRAVTPASFAPDAVLRPEVQAMSARLALKTYRPPGRYADMSPAHPDRLRLRLRGGGEIALERALVPGGEGAYLTVDQLRAKAEACFAAGGYARDAADRLIGALLSPDESIPTSAFDWPIAEQALSA